MNIVKLVHSCLLVEDKGDVALFDPGVYSREAIEAAKLSRLDFIFITHQHPDHMDAEVIRHLARQFPEVQIVAPDDAKGQLIAAGVVTTPIYEISDVSLFHSPHESTEPSFATPEEIGIHFHGKFSDPGDSHSFTETKQVLALPIQAPWGSTLNAIRLALQLKPRHIIPIHDWHWSDEARLQMYDMCEGLFAREGITFHKPKTNQMITIDLSA